MRILFTLLFLVLAIPAYGHSWYSMTGCCGGNDCRSIGSEDLKFVISENGPSWLVISTGELIPVDSARISPNDQNHRCEYLAGTNKGKTRTATVNNRSVYCLWIAGGT